MSLKIRYQIWKLRRSQARSYRGYEEDVVAAGQKKDGKQDAIRRIRGEQRHVWTTDSDQIEVLETALLRSRARSLCVPVPAFDDKASWEEAFSACEDVLTTQAKHSLIVALRGERNARWESVRLWLPVVASVIGAAAAWVAVVWRK